MTQVHKSKVLCFAGEIASGKSTLSKLVAAELGWKRAGFGDFLREQARLRGLDLSNRVVLQHLGQEFISQGWRPFCLQVLNMVRWVPGENLVVDGIRHIEAVNTVELLTKPSSTKLVYVTAAQDIRMQRAVARGREVDLTAESHPVESEVRTLLPARSDFLIDNSLRESAAVQNIVTQLNSWIYES